MGRDDIPELSGKALTRDVRFTFVELCELSGAQTEFVIECVEHGLLEPSGEAPPAWHFPANALWRIQVVMRLQRDLDINIAGAALVLDLLDEMEDLRTQVRILERQLFHFELPEDEF